MESKPDLNEPMPRSQLASFCHKWHVKELAVFGSVLTDKFDGASDIDILITYTDETPLNLRAIYEMDQELQGVFGRPVDVVSRSAIEKSTNPIKKELILGNARVLVAA